MFMTKFHLLNISKTKVIKNKNPVRKSSPQSSAFISLVNLYQILIIILFIKYELFNKQEVAAKAKALIYNKDGKFIYRPAKAGQGHIIVIDDRHHHHQDEHKSESDSNHLQATYQPIQLVSSRIHFQPATATATINPATAATATSYYPSSAASSSLPGQVQIISLAELPSVPNPLTGASAPPIAPVTGYSRGAYPYHQPQATQSAAAAGSMVNPSNQVVPLIQLAYARPNELLAQQQRKSAPAPIVSYGTSYYPTQAIPPSPLANDFQSINGQLAAALAAQQASAAAAVSGSAIGADSSTVSLLNYAPFQQPPNILAAPQQLFTSYNNPPQLFVTRQSRNLDLDNGLNLDLSSLQASPAFQDEPLTMSQRSNFYASAKKSSPGGRGLSSQMTDSFDLENRENSGDYHLSANPYQQQQPLATENVFDDSPQQHTNNNNNNNSPSRNGYQHHSKRHNHKSSFDTSIPGFIPPPPPPAQHQHQQQQQQQHQQQQIQNSDHRNAAQTSGSNEDDQNGYNGNSYGQSNNDVRMRSATSSLDQDHKKMSSKFMNRIPQHQMNAHSRHSNSHGKQKSSDPSLLKRFPPAINIDQSSAQLTLQALLSGTNQSKDSDYWSKFRDQYDIIS